jgi:hypothetical protein
MLAWMVNGTVRGGGISPRSGWTKLATVVKGPHPGFYQSGLLYEEITGNPYLMMSIGGRIYQVLVNSDNSVHDLSASSGLTNPATIQRGYMTQAEQFVVIQAGDWQVNIAGTPPLFWDGATLRRSIGITNTTPGPPAPGINEIPSALAMVYYQGRLWYSNGLVYAAGDIVFGKAGTAIFNFKDSVLNVTENPLSFGGDGFAVPSQAGDITALSYTANLNAQLGQGPLYIFTRRQVYALQVPVSRNDWIAANTNNQPLQTVAQTKYGSVGDRCVTRVNGDIFYQSVEPAVRSLMVATRFFGQWANVPISTPVQRAFDFTNPILMATASGIEFDNRLLQTVVPVLTVAGVAFQGIVSLDFFLVSTLADRLPPAWEGMYSGLNILQLFEGDFGGVQRAFATVLNSTSGDIEVWELSQDNKRDNGDNRIPLLFETPAYTFNADFEFKQLDGGEIWVDRISGEVDIRVEYRVDADPCWQPWFDTRFCAARSTCEDLVNPICYPTKPYCEGYKFPITLPKPQPGTCETMQARPTNRGYQFQVRITVTGFCRIRGLLLFGLPIERKPFEGLTQ